MEPAQLDSNEKKYIKLYSLFFGAAKDRKYARTKSVGECRLKIHPLSPDQCVSCTTASALQRRNHRHSSANAKTIVSTIERSDCTKAPKSRGGRTRPGTGRLSVGGPATTIRSDCINQVRDKIATGKGAQAEMESPCSPLSVAMIASPSKKIMAAPTNSISQALWPIA